MRPTLEMPYAVDLGAADCLSCDVAGAGLFLHNGRCTATAPPGHFLHVPSGTVRVCRTCAAGTFADGGCSGTQDTVCTACQSIVSPTAWATSLLSWNSTFMPSDVATRATWLPMEPRPSTPKVFP